MNKPSSRTWWLAASAFVCISGTFVAGDTLILRDGRRVEGVLVAVRGDTIDFELRGGRDDGRVRRFDRDAVRAIQFDDRARDGYAGDLADRGRDGMRERTLNVSARTQWTRTGIDVRSGQTIFFSASGEIRWGPGRKDGAGGERNSPYNHLRPMPDRNAAALIGRIGEDGDPFFIGDGTGPIRVRASGPLFLGVNDDHVSDNSGSFRIVIAY